MPTITVETYLQAPVETCFDLARDIGLHCQTAASTKERAVAGVTSGLIGLGDEVTFEAVHLGVRQRLRVRVTQFDRPQCFVDEMQSGVFHSLRHVHTFAAAGTGTRMTDTLVWVSPLGILGRVADHLFLVAYLRRFLSERNAGLQRVVGNIASAEPPSV